VPAIFTYALLAIPLIGAYAIFALGISAIYRASRVRNLAHGAMAMPPAYLTYTPVKGRGADWGRARTHRRVRRAASHPAFPQSLRLSAGRLLFSLIGSQGGQRHGPNVCISLAPAASLKSSAADMRTPVRGRAGKERCKRRPAGKGRFLRSRCLGGLYEEEVLCA
jgi:hypothetical protein